MNMQLFKTFKSTEAQDLTPEQVFDLICNDEELKKSTELHRDLLAQGHEKAAKEVKESTPQVAASFRMEGGKGKGNCRECLGNVLIDFDAKSPEERLPADELERLEKDADRIGSKNVCFKGRVDKKQIPAILAGGDALFLDPFDEAVSRYGISSNKLFEYFAAGKPILICSLPGHNPAERFHCSITYENTPEGVAAAIRKAFSLREDEREEMRRGALAAAEEYSFDTLSAKLDSVLEGTP